MQSPGCGGILVAVDPVEFLTRCGGLSAARPLVAVCGRTAVSAAVRAGMVVRTGRGRYALVQVESALRAAHGASGVLTHTSAAAWWGWEAKLVPGAAHVTVPRNRRPRQMPGVHLWFRDLPQGDVVAPGVTSPLRTVLDCASTLPFDEALAIADSAVRHRCVGREELRLAAQNSPGRGHGRRVKVALAADGRADNPFESVLRAVALDVGLDVVPQVPLYTPSGWVRPDLLDSERGLAIEAESFTWHGRREQLVHDTRKYNDLGLLGLLLLRFSWEHVMLRQEYVSAVLGRARAGVAPWKGPQATYPHSHCLSA